MNDKRELHVIFGNGPLGKAVMRTLLARGHAVRLVSRSGRAEVPAGGEVVAADASDLDQAKQAAGGAHVIYHCAQPAYGQWPRLAPALTRGILGAAEAVGATLVYGDNLYMYGPVDGPLHEGLPYAATGPNGRTRAALAHMVLDAHTEERVRTVIGRGSNFYGPEVLTSSVGQGVFGRILDGKPAQVLGNPDQPHSLTFIDDFAAALVTLGEHPEALGKAWHVPNAPALTTREFVRLVVEEADTGARAKVMVAPRLALTTLSLWNPTMRAVRESLYQSERAWIVDHSRYATAFGDFATPHREGVRATLAWYRSRRAAPSTSGTVRSRERNGVS